MSESQQRESVPALPASDPRLGVRSGSGVCSFGVFAEADRVSLRLVHPGTRRTLVRPMDPDSAIESAEGGRLWEVSLPLDLRHWSYSYEIERDGQTLSDIVDPRATLVHQGRGFISHDSTSVTPRPDFDPSSAIIYELHIRDFTRDEAGGVHPEWRGRYLGLTQAGTKLGGTSYPTGLDHICELGVTVVQLMPVHAFAMPHHREYEWGYMPNDFNAPHPGYASSVELDAPIREFKRLVSALHERGLRVSLDVVYNHTAERWPDRLRSLMALAPREYFRVDSAGNPSDGSACGNEFRSESPQGRRFLLDSVRYWLTEFGVDGFRFDLMGLIDAETMAMVAQIAHGIDPTIMVYGEPWAAAPTPIEVNSKGRQRSRGWGVFNDEMRDGLRGGVFDDGDPGFLVSGTGVDRVKAGIVGGVRTFADSARETINYIEAHDNHTLADRLRLTAPASNKITDQQRTEMNALGALVLLTSQGVPFLHSGQEFGRTKDLEDNSYNLGDQINNIRWKHKAEHYRLFTFYRQVIAMRREHPMFRLSDREQIEEAIAFFDDDLGLAVPNGAVGYRITDVTGRDSWAEAVVLLNGNQTPVTMPLPEPGAGESGGPKRRSTDAARSAWRLFALDGHVASEQTEHAGELLLPPHYGAVLFVSR